MPSKNRKIINPSALFYADGFTHAVIPKGQQTVYLSGQLAWDENFQVIGPGDLAKQTTQVYKNIQHILDELGATWDHVVKTTIYTTQPHESETIARIKHSFLNGVASHAESLIGVQGLAAPELLIEVEAIVVM